MFLLFIPCNNQIFICRTEIGIAALLSVLHENTVHDIRNLRFDWLEKDNQILHGAVSGTDIHTADFLADGLFHTFQSMFNRFDIWNRADGGFHCDHDEIAMALASNAELAHVFVLTGEIPVIQVHGTNVGAAFPERLGHKLQVFADTGGKEFFAVNLLVEEELILAVLFDVVECFISFLVTSFKVVAGGTHANSG